MKNFIKNFATVVLMIAAVFTLYYLSNTNTFDGTWKHTGTRIIIVSFLFLLHAFLYSKRNKKLYYTDNEVIVHCPNCGCECDESNRLIFHKEKKEDETICDGLVMCNKCISNPKTINIDKVYSKLIEWKWIREEAADVEEAIEQLQNGNTEVIMQI